MEKRNYVKPESVCNEIITNKIIASSKGTGGGEISNTCGWNDAEAVLIIDPYNYGPEHLYTAQEVHEYLSGLNGKTTTFCADGNDSFTCNGKTINIDCGYNYQLTAGDIIDGVYYFTIKGLGTTCEGHCNGFGGNQGNNRPG